MTEARPSLRLPLALAAAFLVILPGVSCAPPDAGDRPNVLWIVWDTVRADRLSVYGYERPTTPFLDRWSLEARVFEDCVSVAGSTTPSHASMFTGLLPTEHGAFHTNNLLDQELTTLAELLRDTGYQTYLFAANPHIQAKQNFDQGFDLAEHPWSDRYREEALQIVREKIAPQDRSSNLRQKIQSGDVGPWNIKAAGEVAHEALVNWLGQRDEDRPWFAFLNYMEAHIPYIPAAAFREQMLTAEQIAQSYTVDNSPLRRWAYNFELYDYDQESLDVIGAVYDATLLELDSLLERLLGDLDSRGLLENTIVVLVADHGEHLGEHHLLDHQFSLYDGSLRVPLIVHAPGRLEPGRDRSPVMNYDIFPTLLEMCGVDPPADTELRALSLLESSENRQRLAEYPAPFGPAIRSVQMGDPNFDPTPWLRRLRAYYSGPHKLICATDGRHELYDLSADPGELSDLYETDARLGEEMMARLLEISDSLERRTGPGERRVDHSGEEAEMLRALGYLGGGDSDGDDVEPIDGGMCGF